MPSRRVWPNARFQSTLSMRRATVVDAAHFVAIVISIHALHEESDDGVAAEFVHALVISIHALHEESDPTAWRTVQSSSEFQSTLSMRRATKALYGCTASIHDFNPRSP